MDGNGDRCPAHGLRLALTGRFGGTRRSSAGGKAPHRNAELQQHPNGADDACNIGHYHRRIPHHLQDSRVVTVKTALVERLPAIAQRVVHPDHFFAINILRRVDQANAAGIVLRGIRAWIAIIAEFHQLYFIGQGITLGAELQIQALPIAQLHFLGPVQRLGRTRGRYVPRDWPFSSTVTYIEGASAELLAVPSLRRVRIETPKPGPAVALAFEALPASIGPNNSEFGENSSTCNTTGIDGSLTTDPVRRRSCRIDQT